MLETIEYLRYKGCKRLLYRTFIFKFVQSHKKDNQ